MYSVHSRGRVSVDIGLGSCMCFVFALSRHTTRKSNLPAAKNYNCPLYIARCALGCPEPTIIVYLQRSGLVWNRQCTASMRETRLTCALLFWVPSRYQRELKHLLSYQPFLTLQMVSGSFYCMKRFRVRNEAVATTGRDYAVFTNVVFLTTDMRRICYSFTAISDGVAENTEILSVLLEPLPDLTSGMVEIVSSRQSAQIFISKYALINIYSLAVNNLFLFLLLRFE